MNVTKLEPKRFNRLACLIIIIAGLIVYSDTTHSSFHFDDYPSIVDNTLIRDLHNIPKLFQQNDYTSRQRGVVTTSFALNYYFSGLSVEGYHWTNISIHLFNGILVYFLVIIILNQYISATYVRDTSRVPVLALFVALLFITSPVQTHTVNYIVERNGELASTFYLLSLLFFAKAVSLDKAIVPLYALSIVFFLVSTYCKEIAYTAVMMMFLYYLCFVSRDWRGWPRGFVLVVPYILIAAIRTKLSIPIIAVQPFAERSIAEWQITAIVEYPWQYQLTQAVVLLEYIKLLAWPLPYRLNVDYDVNLVNTIWALRTVTSAMGVIGLLCSALILILRNRARLLAFFILWFIVVSLPHRGFLWQGQLMVCYRMYLPGLAFYTLLVVGIHKLFCYLGKRKKVEPKRLRLIELVVLTGIVLFYSVCAYEHNKVWKTEVLLWEDAVKKSPNKQRPHFNLGKAYELAGMLDNAKALYVSSMEMFERNTHPRSLIEDIESYYKACITLAGIYSGEGRHAEAIDLYRKGLRIYPREANGHNNLGLAYYRAGNLEEAEREFEIAIEFKPGLSVAHENLGALYEVKGERNAALAELAEAIIADSKNAKAHIRLGQLWWNYKNRPDIALMHLEEALKLDIDRETTKRVLLAIDSIRKQSMHLLRPPIEKAP